MRASGFTEAQTDALEEIADATVGAARADMTKQVETNERYYDLQLQLAALTAEMKAMKWWLFGSISLMIATATAIILAAIAIWG